MAGDKEPRSLIVPGETSIVRTMTPDGTAVLVSNQVTKGYEDYLIRSDRPGAVRLSSGEGMTISPDGRWSLAANPGFDTFSITPTGMGSTREVPNLDKLSYLSIPAWLPDSKRFLGTARKGDEPSRGYVIDASTGAGTPFGDAGMKWPFFSPPAVSPDGREVVLQDAEGASRRWPIAGGAGVAIPGIGPEDQPLAYAEDGKALFVTARKFPVEVERLDLSTGRRTPWLTLSPDRAAGMRYWIPTITPSGKHWALCTGRLLSDLYVVEGLR